MLDEMLHRNASKFAILLESKNLCNFYYFSLGAKLPYYSLLNYLGENKKKKVWQMLKY